MLSEFLTRGSLSGTPTTEESAANTQQFLRFHLVPDTTALLPVHQMTEVLTIPIAQVVPIPDMPAWVMGVYNWRGEILWIVDLGHLVGLTPLYQQATSRPFYTAIVIHNARQVRSSFGAATLTQQQVGSQSTGRKLLGVVVNRVEDMEWCNPDLIQSPPPSALSPELVPFLRGYWLKSNGEILIVLDGNSIVAGMP